MNDTKILELITELRTWKTEQKCQERKVYSGPSGYNGRYSPRLGRSGKVIRQLESKLLLEVYKGVR